jgi:Polyketide cyclase / dehydrase and lipid transport
MRAMRSARAVADVSASAGTVYGFLSDLGNHWRLASRWIEVMTLKPATGTADGATVRLNGPFGMSRTVHTRVDASIEPTLVRGQGSSGRTGADVEWQIAEHGEGTRVSVEVRLRRAQLRDRVIWSIGGRAWLARRLQQTLSELDDTLDAHVQASAAARSTVSSS